MDGAKRQLPPHDPEDMLFTPATFGLCENAGQAVAAAAVLIADMRTEMAWMRKDGPRDLVVPRNSLNSAMAWLTAAEGYLTQVRQAIGEAAT